MNDNDILVYKKYNFDDIKEIVLFLANPKNINRTSLTNIFSNKCSKQDPKTGEISVTAPKYKITDYFDLPAKVLPNQPTEVKDTTLGIFLFNSYVLCQAFGEKIQYVNETLNEKWCGKIQNELAKLIIEKQLTTEQYAKFTSYSVWLGYQNEIVMPGMSVDLIVPPKEVTDLKKTLMKEHPELVEKKVVDIPTVSAYHDKIEKPLLDKAEEVRDNNYAGRIYEMKKPSFGNNYKNRSITNGAMFDPVSGKYKINTNSFNEGIDEWNFDVLANKCMVASYNRGVNTQIGGTYAKYVGIMMQTVRAGPKGSDCGSKNYVKLQVTDDNKDIIVSSYGLIDGKDTLITDAIAKKLVGKTISLRSPLFCKNPHYLCNKCIGNRFYDLGIENIGLTTNVPLDAQKLKSMKSMHDVSINTITVNPIDHIEFFK